MKIDVAKEMYRFDAITVKIPNAMLYGNLKTNLT